MVRRWLCGIGVMVVAVLPDAKGLGSAGCLGPQAGVCPFVEQVAVEAFDAVDRDRWCNPGCAMPNSVQRRFHS